MANRTTWTIVGCVGGCLLIVVLIGSCVALTGGGVFMAMRNNDAYRMAMERAQASPAVQAELGEPIEAGWLQSGSFSSSGASGEADLQIPISGPDGSGKLYLVATKTAGEWEFELLEVEIESTGERIDLLAEPAPTP